VAREDVVRGSLVVVLAIATACATGGDADVEDDGGAAIPKLDAGTNPTPVDSGLGPDAPSPTDGGKEAASDACTAALAAISFTFDTGAQGFTHGISDGVTPPPAWPYDPWTLGTAATGTTCNSGACFGTELTQNYAQCQRGYLLSPPIDLSACAGRTIAIAFEHAYSFWTGSYLSTTYADGGIVEVSANGSTWVLATGTYPGTVAINPDRGASYACVQSNNFGVDGKSGFVGLHAATEHVELGIPASAIGATTQVRFSFASGVSSQTTDANQSRTMTAFGWRIDDIGFVVK
jgi:hypothetical protein